MATTKSGTKPASKTFSAEERAAMKEYVREKKAQAASANGESEVLAKIKEMPKADRALAERVHAIVKATAPELVPRTYYGMPAYAKDGSVVLFFKNASKFKQRYATLGFTDKAKIDDGAMWATEFAVTELTPAEEKKITTLLKKAVK
jgi:uncharacterized protein YdhG (YjbR/CyaY superfamily)